MSNLSQSDRDLLREARVIVIIGLPAAGKTTVCDAICEILPEHNVYHSDDYLDYGYERSLYVMMGEIAQGGNPLFIVEGVQGFRFLRKNAQLQTFPVDLIISVEASIQDRIERYKARGKTLSQSFDRNLETVWHSYLKEVKESGQNLPRIINLHT